MNKKTLILTSLCYTLWQVQFLVGQARTNLFFNEMTINNTLAENYATYESMALRVERLSRYSNITDILTSPIVIPIYLLIVILFVILMVYDGYLFGLKNYIAMNISAGIAVTATQFILSSIDSITIETSAYYEYLFTCTKTLLVVYILATVVYMVSLSVQRFNKKSNN